MVTRCGMRNPFAGRFVHQTASAGRRQGLPLTVHLTAGQRDECIGLEQVLQAFRLPRPRGRTCPCAGESMAPFRIELGNLRVPATPDESVTLAVEASAKAAAQGARLVCFPECFVTGYRGFG